jgi:hypothetical protein
MSEFLNQSIYYPDESIREKFKSGQLESVRKHLFDFVIRHRDELTHSNDDIAYDNLFNMINKRGSVHLPSEMADQIKEINKEIWYRGEDGDLNRRDITENWTYSFSMKWRTARKMEILFLVKECRNELIDLIKKGR